MTNRLAASYPPSRKIAPAIASTTSATIFRVTPPPFPRTEESIRKASGTPIVPPTRTRFRLLINADRAFDSAPSSAAGKVRDISSAMQRFKTASPRYSRRWHGLCVTPPATDGSCGNAVHLPDFGSNTREKDFRIVPRLPRQLSPSGNRGFREDVERPADLPGQERFADPGIQNEKTGHPSFLLGGGDVVGKSGALRSGAGRIGKYVQVGHRQVPKELHRLLEIRWRLARESRDDVRTQGKVRNLRGRPGDGVPVLGGTVRAPHPRKRPVTPALKRDVQVGAHPGVAGNGLDQPIRQFPGFDGAEPDSRMGCLREKAPDQSGQGVPSPGVRPVQADVDPRQDELARPAFFRRDRSCDEFLFRDGAVLPAGQGHHAIRAGKIAPVLDFQECPPVAQEEGRGVVGENRGFPAPVP